MHDTLLPEPVKVPDIIIDPTDLRDREGPATDAILHHQRVWNALIPASTIRFEVMPWGVRYLHPTKGWKTVGKRRFAVRGVL